MGMRAPFFKSIELSYMKADAKAHVYVGKWRSYNTFELWFMPNMRTTALGDIQNITHDKFLDAFRGDVKIRYADD